VADPGIQQVNAKAHVLLDGDHPSGPLLLLQQPTPLRAQQVFWLCAFKMCASIYIRVTRLATSQVRLRGDKLRVCDLFKALWLARYWAWFRDHRLRVNFRGWAFKVAQRQANLRVD
jgi:hypothetical protein